MSGLETMHDLLHDPAKRKPWVKRFEMLAIVCLMSGSWIAAGYVWGNKNHIQEIEALRADFSKQRDALREAQGKKLEELRTQCVAKEVKKP